MFPGCPKDAETSENVSRGEKPVQGFARAIRSKPMPEAFSRVATIGHQDLDGRGSRSSALCAPARLLGLHVRPCLARAPLPLARYRPAHPRCARRTHRSRRVRTKQARRGPHQLLLRWTRIRANRPENARSPRGPTPPRHAHAPAKRTASCAVPTARAWRVSEMSARLAASPRSGSGPSQASRCAASARGSCCPRRLRRSRSPRRPPRKPRK